MMSVFTPVGMLWLTPLSLRATNLLSTVGVIKLGSTTVDVGSWVILAHAARPVPDAIAVSPLFKVISSRTVVAAVVTTVADATAPRVVAVPLTTFPALPISKPEPMSRHWKITSVPEMRVIPPSRE